MEGDFDRRFHGTADELCKISEDCVSSPTPTRHSRFHGASAPEPAAIFHSPSPIVTQTIDLRKKSTHNAHHRRAARLAGTDTFLTRMAALARIAAPSLAASSSSIPSRQLEAVHETVVDKHISDLMPLFLA